MSGTKTGAAGISLGEYVKFPLRYDEYAGGYVWDADDNMIFQVREFGRLMYKIVNGERVRDEEHGARLQDEIGRLLVEILNSSTRLAAAETGADGDVLSDAQRLLKKYGEMNVLDTLGRLEKAEGENERLREAGRWISVDERLPTEEECKSGERFLVTMESNGRRRVMEWSFSLHFNDFTPYVDGRVLAWMPLPAPFEPRAEEGQK